MPYRHSSQWFLRGGITLVLVSGVLITTPTLLEHQARTPRITQRTAHLQEITRSADGMRDLVDLLRQTRGAERGYLLTGSVEERTNFENLAQAAQQRLHALQPSEVRAADWPQFKSLANDVLTDLTHAVALQAAGQHDAAVSTSEIRLRQHPIAGLTAIMRSRLDILHFRYQAVLARIRKDQVASDRIDAFLFLLAGACFALGCMMVATFVRRHLAMETELRQGRDEALEATGIKTRFIATASHDLRQPLHAISMFLGVLRRRSRDPAILEVVDSIASAVSSMQRMFAALLDVARLDAGAVKIESRAIHLDDLFTSLRLESAASAAAKGLALHIQPTPLSVVTDPALLETILRNLLSNAIKFTDHGTVGIAAHRAHGEVTIIVFDTGLGIPAKDHATIFQQFERLEQPGGGREGLGLGLSIVQRMAGLLGVNVTVDSEPGKGSRFALSLPSGDLLSVPALKTTTAGPDLRGQRVLVLDDHTEARRAIALGVASMGAVALEAGSPDEAARLLDVPSTEAPHAAVVDHDLGGGRIGPDFLTSYAGRTGRELPAVIITGSTEAATLAALAAAGRPWLIKPVDFDVLRLTLAALLDIEPGQ